MKRLISSVVLSFIRYVLSSGLFDDVIESVVLKALDNIIDSNKIESMIGTAILNIGESDIIVLPEDTPYVQAERLADRLGAKISGVVLASREKVGIIRFNEKN